MTSNNARSVQTISVIVPANPFIPNQGEVVHCLAALDVVKLMDWWPGTPDLPPEISTS
jgi:hypothetical protein